MNQKKISKNGTYEYEIKYNGVNIVIDFNIEDSKKHLLEDYKVLEKEGIENIIKNQFIFWLKGEEFKNRDNNKTYEGLKVYGINYHYSKIIDKYSPTGEENYIAPHNITDEERNNFQKIYQKDIEYYKCGVICEEEKNIIIDMINEFKSQLQIKDDNFE